jgi:pimeloyl-ACP methyl ester carboxylesterase
VLRAVALAALLAASLPAAAERNVDIIDDAIYLKPRTKVPVEGARKLNLHCAGKGTITVVFDAGLGEDMKVWALVQPRVAQHTRACAYDRAGLGFSDPSPAARTSAFHVRDLHRLLVAARVPPPYILVGHSFGGMNVKLFAETYPTEVAGLVFVDPSHEDLARRAWALSPERAAAGLRYYALMQSCLDARSEDLVAGAPLTADCATPPNADRFSADINAMEAARDVRHDVRYAWTSEQFNVWTASADQLRAARRPLGDLPIVVLTHEPLPRRDGESQAMTDAQNALRTELHTDIAQMSTRGSIRTVRDSGHHFQLDQPQEVVAAIVDVLAMARRRPIP